MATKRCTSLYPGAATLKGRPIRCDGESGHVGDHGNGFAARYWTDDPFDGTGGHSQAARPATHVAPPLCAECGLPVRDGTNPEGDTWLHWECDDPDLGPKSDPDPDEGADCPEWCNHGGACEAAREAISKAEAWAEGAYDRMAEAGYPGYDEDPNDFGGWAGTGQPLWPETVGDDLPGGTSVWVAGSPQ